MKDIRSEESKSTVPVRRKRNPIKVLLLLVTIPLIVGVSCYLWHVYSARKIQKEFRLIVDELHAKGEPVFNSELEWFRTPLPDDENGALLIEKLGDDFLYFEDRSDKVIWYFGDDPDLNQPVDPESLARSRQFLEEHRDSLDSLDSLLDYRKARLSWDFSDVPDGAMSLPLYYLRTFLKVEDLMELDIGIALIDGHPERCPVRVRQLWRMGSFLDSEPVTGSILRAMGMKSAGAKSLRSILHHSSLSSDDLLAIQQEIENAIASVSLYRFALSERVSLLATLEKAYRLLEEEREKVLTEKPGVDAIQVREAQLAFLKDYDPFLESAKAADWLKFLDQLDVFNNQLKSDLEELGTPDILSVLILWQPSSAVCNHLQTSAALSRCALMGVAAERYRLATCQWPDSLDALVPEYVAAVAIDPFDGQPLRYRRTEDGIIVYSVLTDGQDDGGLRRPPGTSRKVDDRYDLVYSIPDPEKRAPVRIQPAAEESPPQPAGEMN